MKGVYPAEEIAALPAGWEVTASHPLRVPGVDAERHLSSSTARARADL
jgi:16S rRNA (guanine527-N7)-methyltransferase